MTYARPSLSRKFFDHFCLDEICGKTQKIQLSFTHHSLARLVSIGFHPTQKNHVQDFLWTVFMFRYYRLKIPKITTPIDSVFVRITSVS